MGEKGGSIPYRQVEYLESNGGARIVTDYIPKGYDIEIYAKFYLDSYNAGGNWQSIYFARGQSGSSAYALQRNGTSNTLCGAWNGTKSTNQTNLNIAPGNTYILHFYNVLTSGNYIQYFEVNGATTSANIVISNENNGKLSLFATSVTSADYVNAKLYYFKVYKNNILEMDLVPVRIGQVGYMYDTISKQLYGNAHSSGSLIAGPDIN